jgi:hypothetical protein
VVEQRNRRTIPSDSIRREADHDRRRMGCAMRPDYPSVCFDYDSINDKTRGNKGGGIKRLCHAVIPFGKHQT